MHTLEISVCISKEVMMGEETSLNGHTCSQMLVSNLLMLLEDGVRPMNREMQMNLMLSFCVIF